MQKPLIRPLIRPLIKLLILFIIAASPALCSQTGAQFAYGVRTIGTATGNVSVTGLTFQPEGGLFIMNGQTTQNALATGVQLGIGAAISSSNRAAFYHRRETSTTAWSRHSDAVMMTTINSSGTVTMAADFVSWNTDGFTLNLSLAPGVTFYLRWWVWGGSDIQTNLVQFNSPVTTGTQAYTGMGFQSDVLLFFSAGMTATIPTTDGNARPGFGWAVSTSGTITQAGLGNKQVTATNTSRRAQSSSEAVYIPDTSGIWLSGSVSAIGSDGWSITYTNVQASAVRLWALGIRGLRGYSGSFDQSASTGSQSNTDVLWKPSLLFMASFCRTAASGQQNDGMMSLGGASDTAQGNLSIATTTGTNNTGEATYDNQILTCLTPGTPTIASQASLTSLDSVGFTLNNTTADGTARRVLFLALGPLPVNRMLITTRRMPWLRPLSTD